MKTTIDEIATQFNITKKLSKEVIDAVVLSFEKNLVAEGQLKIVGLGSFKIEAKPARNGVNPKTQEKIVIPERKTVKFKVTKTLKEAIQ